MFDQTLANKSKVKIGICVECDYMPVSQATKRAIAMARDVLTKQGYECVDVKITNEEICGMKSIFSEFITTGFAEDWCKGVEKHGERMDKGNSGSFLLFRAGPVKKWFLLTLMRLLNKGRLAEDASHFRILDIQGLNLLAKHADQVAKKFSRKWQELGLTCLIQPVMNHAAFKHENCHDIATMTHYMVMWNFLNYPSGVVPVTRVREDEQDFDDKYKDSWTELIKDICKDSVGLPIGVQVIAHSYEDEKALAIMQVLEQNLPK